MLEFTVLLVMGLVSLWALCVKDQKIQALENKVFELNVTVGIQDQALRDVRQELANEQELVTKIREVLDGHFQDAGDR